MRITALLPLAVAGTVFVFVGTVMIFFSNNNNGVEFFVESEPEQAIVYVLARGNLSLDEKDVLVRQVEDMVLDHPGVKTAFSFAGEGGLNTDASGASKPKDMIGQVQLETIPWEERADRLDLDGDLIIAELTEQLSAIPGIRVEILAQARGPASGKPVHLRLKADSFDDLLTSAALVRAEFEATPGLTLVEDTRPLPGIDWQIDVDVEKAGRYGADVATVGAMVQLVTRGLLLDTMRVDTSDEEIEIRVRLPQKDRVLSTLDTLKVRTVDGLVPLSNFITRTPVPKLAEIARVDQKRYFDVKADVGPGLMKLVQTARDDTGAELDQTVATLRPADADADITAPDGSAFKVTDRAAVAGDLDLNAALERGHDVLILTNAMRPMMRKSMQAGLLELNASYPGKLTLRISVDHYDADLHDAERGAGAFDKTLKGMQWLRDNGFTMAVAGRSVMADSDAESRAGYAAFYAEHGFDIDAQNPGMTVLFPEMDESIEVPEITTACWGILNKSPDAVMCSSSRMVVKRKGAERPSVLACTLLPYDKEFELGTSLEEAERDVSLNHPHCAKFCVLGGASCSA
mgnify:CR=1 FL=1